ncbi:MAG: MBL fold metallo-hydrolase [Gemmatimonadota bacterium]
MIREIVPGFFWLQECGPDRPGFTATRNTHPVDWYVPGREVHVPQNAYLLRAGKSLLFDTLSPAGGEQVLRELEAVLEGRGLDYLVVSHPDVPHAGNTHRILAAHPETALVAPATGDIHALYHLEDSLRVGPGDGLDLDGFRVRFHEATFLDAPLSIWMSEESTNALFPVDWMGFPHMRGECGRFAEELEGLDEEAWLSRLIDFHGRVMFWYEYVEVPKTRAEIDRLIRALAPSLLAPAHGLVIREEPARYMELIKRAVAAIAERGRVGTLG